MIGRGWPRTIQSGLFKSPWRFIYQTINLVTSCVHLSLGDGISTSPNHDFFYSSIALINEIVFSTKKKKKVRSAKNAQLHEYKCSKVIAPDSRCISVKE